jgi:hypothetical protein
MPRVEFELTIPMFGQAKTFHALECVAIVMDHPAFYQIEMNVTKLVSFLDCDC